jgi:hypothetical protein
MFGSKFKARTRSSPTQESYGMRAFELSEALDFSFFSFKP